MSYDAKNIQTFTNLITSASYATNNAATAGVDLKGFDEPFAVLVNIGVKTAGDNDGAVSMQLQHSATNNASNATNISSSAVVSTTNNTANHDTLQVDPRGTYRYMFGRRIITGTNSPAYPMSATMIYQKKKVS